MLGPSEGRHDRYATELRFSVFASLTKQGYASAPKAILLPLTPYLLFPSINNILVSFMVLRVHLCYAVGESSLGRKADIP